VASQWWQASGKLAGSWQQAGSEHLAGGGSASGQMTGRQLRAARMARLQLKARS